jgi:hypothetical protein
MCYSIPVVLLASAHQTILPALPQIPDPPKNSRNSFRTHSYAMFACKSFVSHSYKIIGLKVLCVHNSFKKPGGRGAAVSCSRARHRRPTAVSIPTDNSLFTAHHSLLVHRLSAGGPGNFPDPTHCPPSTTHYPPLKMTNFCHTAAPISSMMLPVVTISIQENR